MSNPEVFKESLCAAIYSRNKELLNSVSPEIVKLGDKAIKALIKDLEKKFDPSQIKWLHNNLNSESVIKLSDEEIKERDEAEKNIKHNSRDYVAKGESFKRIIDKKLYRGTHFSVEQYCKDTFGLDERTYRRYVFSAQVYNELKEFFPEEQLPNNFYVASELVKIKAMPLVDFWRSVLNTSSELNIPITGRFISKFYDQLKVELEDTNTISEGTIVCINRSKHQAASTFKMWGRLEEFSQGRYCVYVGKPKLFAVTPSSVEELEGVLDIHVTVLELSMSHDRFVSSVAQAFFFFKDYNEAQINYIEQLRDVINGN
jgi:hypothetical protein